MRKLNFAKIISLTLLLLFGLIFSKGGLDLKAGALLSSQAQAATCRNIGWCNVGQKGSPCGANQFCASCVGGEYICYDECPPGTAPKCSGPCISCEPVGPPVCTPGAWTDAGCGKGGCASDQMYQTRTCSPAGCCTTEQCVSDPTCKPPLPIPPTAKCPLINETTWAPTPVLTTPEVIVGNSIRNCLPILNDPGEAFRCALGLAIDTALQWLGFHFPGSFSHSTPADYAAGILTDVPDHPAYRRGHLRLLSRQQGEKGEEPTGIIPAILPPGYTQGGFDPNLNLFLANNRTVGEWSLQPLCKYKYNEYESEDHASNYCAGGEGHIFNLYAKFRDRYPYKEKARFVQQILVPGAKKVELPNCTQALGSMKIDLQEYKEVPGAKIIDTYVDDESVVDLDAVIKKRTLACSNCVELDKCGSLPDTDPCWDLYKACVQNYCAGTGTVAEVDTHDCPGAPPRAKICLSNGLGDDPLNCMENNKVNPLTGERPCPGYYDCRAELGMKLDESAHSFCDDLSAAELDAWTCRTDYVLIPTVCPNDGLFHNLYIRAGTHAVCGPALPPCYIGTASSAFGYPMDEDEKADTTQTSLNAALQGGTTRWAQRPSPLASSQETKNTSRGIDWAAEREWEKQLKLFARTRSKIAGTQTSVLGQVLASGNRIGVNFAGEWNTGRFLDAANYVGAGGWVTLAANSACGPSLQSVYDENAKLGPNGVNVIIWRWSMDTPEEWANMYAQLNTQGQVIFDMLGNEFELFGATNVDTVIEYARQSIAALKARGIKGNKVKNLNPAWCIYCGDVKSWAPPFHAALGGDIDFYAFNVYTKFSGVGGDPVEGNDPWWMTNLTPNKPAFATEGAGILYPNFTVSYPYEGWFTGRPDISPGDWSKLVNYYLATKGDFWGFTPYGHNVEAPPHEWTADFHLLDGSFFAQQWQSKRSPGSVIKGSFGDGAGFPPNRGGCDLFFLDTDEEGGPFPPETRVAPDPGPGFYNIFRLPSWGDFQPDPGEVTAQANFNPGGIFTPGGKPSNLRVPVAGARGIQETQACIEDELLEIPTAAKRGSCEAALRADPLVAPPPGPPPPPPPPPPIGGCHMGTGFCSPASLTTLGGWTGGCAQRASLICNMESGGNPSAMNLGCTTGKSLDYSIGLFQINLLAHCPGAFDYGAGPPPWCTEINPTFVGICTGQFVDPAYNASYAYTLSGAGQNWSAWGAYKVCKADVDLIPCP